MILWHLAAYAGGELLRLQLTTPHPSPLSVPPHYQQSFPSYRLPQLPLTAPPTFMVDQAAPGTSTSWWVDKPRQRAHRVGSQALPPFKPSRITGAG